MLAGGLYMGGSVRGVCSYLDEIEIIDGAVSVDRAGEEDQDHTYQDGEGEEERRRYAAYSASVDHDGRLLVELCVLPEASWWCWCVNFLEMRVASNASTWGNDQRSWSFLLGGGSFGSYCTN
jgi:hypothetical protein